MLREEAVGGTVLGRLIAARMNSGSLVEDDIVNRAVQSRIARQDCLKGFILDGYPRTAEQAEFLEKIVTPQDRLTAIDIGVSCGQLLQRLTSRRTCSLCAAIYNLITAPPLRKNRCDGCGGALVQRNDDRDEVVQERFRSYMERTEQVATYYRRKGAYRYVNGGVSVDEVSRQIESLIFKVFAPAISLTA